MMNMYPLKFENLYFEKIWGGRDFEAFRSNLPDGNIGESWDVACHKNGTSIVANGEYKGKKLDELIKEKGTQLLGTKIEMNKFPLLIKLINSRDCLSVQVHPDDVYAVRFGEEQGKTEAWYVVEAFEGASIIAGTKEGCTRKQLEEAINENNLEPFMNRIFVNKGEVYFIKSGLIHAIGSGIIIAEIQQNSDITYRVYDYGRGRELHIDKALEVIDLKLRGERCIESSVIKREGFSKVLICSCKEFCLEIYDIENKMEECSDIERFFIFTVVEGEGEIVSKYGTEKVERGCSILIPANLGSYSLIGKMRLLKSYVPSECQH